MPFLPPYLLTEQITVLRRTSYTVASRNILNDPIYGETPTGWNTIYTNMPCRLSYAAKNVRYTPTGELIIPTAELIYDTSLYTLASQDHILITTSPGWPTGVEYVVSEVYSSFYEQGIVNHGFAKILLPVI
jgi:hypothetical protein